MKKSRKSASASEKKTFVCDYCKKEFKQETSFVTHNCVKKKRLQSKDEPKVRMGFIVFQKFFSANYKNAREKTFLDFIDSKSYVPFVAFGEYLHKLNAVRPMEFISFIMRMQLPIAKWNSPDVYELYLSEMLKNESFDVALERTFAVMREWADDRGHDWRDFFRKVEVPIAVLWIMNGKISPWAIYLSSSGNDLLSKFNDEHMKMVSNRLDPTVWQAIFAKHADDVEHIRDTLEQENI